MPYGLRLLVGIIFAAGALGSEPSVTTAADPCRHNMHTNTGYRWVRPTIQDARGLAWLEGDACWNGQWAYLMPGHPVTSGVQNTVGVLPVITRGSFVDSGGTLHIWTDMKFTKATPCGTAVAWVQLRIWVYKNGQWSDGHYVSDNNVCENDMRLE